MKLFKKLLAFTLKQYQTGPYYGAAKDLIGRTSFYFSFFTWLMATVLTYGQIRDFLLGYFPSFTWFSYAVFLVMFLSGILVLMLLEFKIGIPSGALFGTSQRYKHGDPVKGYLEVLQKDFKSFQKETRSQLEEIKKSIKGQTL